MPIKYKGQELHKFADTGGKNKSGFYRGEKSKEEFFIKAPKDKKELFTELFAGLLLNEFKELLLEPLIKEGKLPPNYTKSLIFADLIQFEDGSYGLIQPKVALTELWKIIGTGYKDGSDRDPLWEMLNGPNAYPLLTQGGQYFGLSISLLFSLLLGAYSVHSGNMVRLNPTHAHPLERALQQFARIDWGDAFRYFAAPSNNEDILSPAEYEGVLNIKKWTKGYIANYRNIVGLLTEIAKKGITLTEKMDEVAKKEDTIHTAADLMLTMVKNALSKIPKDLLDTETKKKLATYLAIPEFAEVTFGEEGNYDKVAQTFAGTLNHRLKKIRELKEELAPHQEESSLFKSTIYTSAIPLSVNEEVAFPDFVEDLEVEFPRVNVNLLDFTTLEPQELIQKFNHYLDLITHQIDASNSWQLYPHPVANNNLLVPHYKGDKEIQLGHAFVPQYRESVILRRLFTLDIDRYGRVITHRFRPYETAVTTYRSNTPAPLWTAIENLSTAGLTLIAQLIALKKQQAVALTDVKLKSNELMEPLILGLADAIAAFKLANEKLAVLLQSSNPSAPVEFESNFFYAISEQELKEMTGAQLATICLEELTDKEPSALLFRIIGNNTLWGRMVETLAKEESAFSAREDKPHLEKIPLLSKLHEQIVYVRNHQVTFQSAPLFADKEVALKAFKESAEMLPKAFKAALASDMEKAETEFSELQMRRETYKSQYDKFQQAQDKIPAFSTFEQAYHALPLDLQSDYQNEFIAALELVWQAHLDQFDAAQLSEKPQQFKTLEAFHTKWSKSLTNKQSQAAFEQREKEFSDLQTRHETYKSQRDQFQRAPNKISAFSNFETAYRALPMNLQIDYQEELTAAQRVVWQSHLAQFDVAVNNIHSTQLAENQQQFKTLQTFYSQLPKTLNTEFQTAFEQRSKVNNFYQAVEIYDRKLTLSAKVDAFSTVSEAFSKLGVESITLYEEVKAINSDLSALYINNILPGDTPISDINKALNKLATLLEPQSIDEGLKAAFRNAVLSDKALWDVIAHTNKKNFTTELIADLLELKKFHDEKLQLGIDHNHGEKYSTSVNNFYDQALNIRLSDAPVKEQAKALVDAAQNEFSHRHSTRRLVADVIMMISVLFAGLGLLVGGIRAAKGDSFFFSKSLTTRAQEMTSMIQSPEEENEHARLIDSSPTPKKSR
ncbi:LepB GTPase-activating domain-containing protein [Legionella brunensis]|uniref:Effector protein B, substrate of the Dot/Icm secretion system n=1 Tax=Legionella brunensis TaxID=29422 RepID=A0A0W0SUA1_9GAMM|nr:LepB GTPase-activating domain-containing protein [Legionella brunensis]KTC86967.1 effector protein B, substrate of the Dot/Icm secretion system [Legionella brunensis]